MKVFVAGLVLIGLSGAALLWQRLQHTDLPVASGSEVPGPARTTRCMVWKAQRGKAIVWLCGSFHTMRESDYPLPAPYDQAFAESKVIITEVPQGEDNDRKMREEIQRLSQLSDGGRLSEILSERTRAALETCSRTSALSMEKLQTMKPWMAALAISAAAEARWGYRSALGIERHYSAKSGDRLSVALASPEHQLSFFDKAGPDTQEQMILNAIEEDAAYDSRRELRTIAWREGDSARLATLRDDSMRKISSLGKLLFSDRNAEWLPVIEQFLDGTETVMVLVGAGHLAGRGSLVELLTEKGVVVTQMEYTTTRPAPTR